MLLALLTASALAATPVASLGWGTGVFAQAPAIRTADSLSFTVRVAPWFAVEGAATLGLGPGGLVAPGLIPGAWGGARFGGTAGPYGALRVGGDSTGARGGLALGWSVHPTPGFWWGPELQGGAAYGSGVYAGGGFRMEWATARAPTAAAD